MSYSAQVAANHSLKVSLPSVALMRLQADIRLRWTLERTAALPIELWLKNVLDDPVMPVYWQLEGHDTSLHRDEIGLAVAAWLAARDQAVLSVAMLIGGPAQIRDKTLHRQLTALFSRISQPSQALRRPLDSRIAGQLLEPYTWRRAYVAANDWIGFFSSQPNRHDLPEVQKIITLMRQAYYQGTSGEHHYNLNPSKAYQKKT